MKVLRQLKCRNYAARGKISNTIISVVQGKYISTVISIIELVQQCNESGSKKIENSFNTVWNSQSQKKFQHSSL